MMQSAFVYKMPLLYRIRHPIERLRDYYLNIKYSIQRVHRGWCNMDTFEIDSWFLNVVPEMLRYLREHKCGFPGYIEGEKCSSEDWDNILDKMIECFEKASPENGIISDANVAAKDEGFKLFSKYFYYLWD